jgi:hypothetical protein
MYICPVNKFNSINLQLGNNEMEGDRPWNKYTQLKKSEILQMK